MADHGTIGPRKFLRLAEKILDETIKGYKVSQKILKEDKQIRGKHLNRNFIKTYT